MLCLDVVSPIADSVVCVAFCGGDGSEGTLSNGMSSCLFSVGNSAAGMSLYTCT